MLGSRRSTPGLEQRRRVVGHRVRPRTERRPERQRRRSEDRAPAGPSTAGARRPMGCRRPPRPPRLERMASRAQSARDADAAVDDVVDAADDVLGEEIHDAFGEVVAVRGCPPLIADDTERLAGRGRATGCGPGCVPGSPSPVRRTATPFGRSQSWPFADSTRPPSPPVRPPAWRPHRVDRGRRRHPAHTPRPRARDAIEDLVGGHDDEVQAALGAGPGQDAGGVAVAPHREVRLAGAAIHVRPGGRMDDDVRSVAIETARRSPSGASRSKAARSQAIGPAGPVNGASARAATSARPSRPAAPVTATRISPATSRSPGGRPYWRA